MDFRPPAQFAESASIVLLGSFNPKIFHPEWFLRQKLVGEDTANSAEVKIVSTDITEAVIGEIRVYCDDQRLMFGVASTAFSELLKDLVMGVLQLLPHTPLKAVGLNHDFKFRNQLMEEWHRIGHMLAPKELVWNNLMESPGMAEVSIMGESDWNSFKIVERLSVSPLLNNSAEHPGFQIKSNLHFTLPGTNSDDLMSSEIAIQFIEQNWDRSSKLPNRTRDLIYDALNRN